MVGFMGEPAKEAWSDLRRFIEERYDPVSETVFAGAKYGWAIRYRKGGKPLCTLYPENGGFTVLLVLGKEETEKALSLKNELSSRTYDIIENARQYHDGRWPWIRLLTIRDVDDVEKLLQIKRRPKKT
jgi:hypothetical protein